MGGNVNVWAFQLLAPIMAVFILLWIHCMGNHLKVHLSTSDHFGEQNRRSSFNHIQPLPNRYSKTIPVGVADASVEMTAAEGMFNLTAFPGSVR